LPAGISQSDFPGARALYYTETGYDLIAVIVTTTGTPVKLTDF
jgi:hypothetical protein